MPAPAVLMLGMAWAAIPLALAGPAGVIAGALAFRYRKAFLAMEAATPGHRGVRLSRAIPGLAWTGIALGAAMSVLILALALAS